MNGVFCATLANDTKVLRALAQQNGDVNQRVKDLGALGYYDGQTLLMVAAKTRCSGLSIPFKTILFSYCLLAMHNSQMT